MGAPTRKDPSMSGRYRFSVADEVGASGGCIDRMLQRIPIK